MDVQTVGDNILRLVNDYHSSVGTLFSEIFSDSLFNIQLTDYGFNGHRIPCGLTSARCSDAMDDNTNHFGTLANTGSRALYILNPLAQSGDASDIFHVVFDKRNQAAEIFLQKHISDFLGQYREVDFYSCFHSDLRYEKKFLFNAYEAQQRVQGYVGNLALVRPNILFTAVFEDDEAKILQPVPNIGADMQGIKCDCALYFSEMPGFLKERILAKQNSVWPEMQTIEELLKCGIIFVPKHGDDRFWEPDFSDLESCLIQSMPTNALTILQSMQGLSEIIAQLSNTKVLSVQQIISHSMYWHLSETCQYQSEWNSDVTIEDILFFIEKCFTERKLCHFFIPERNILKQLSEADCLQLHEVFQSLKDNNDFLLKMHSETNIEVSLQNLIKDRPVKEQDHLLETILRSAECSITDAFINTVKVLQLKLFQKLHRGDDVDSCITEHEKALHMLATASGKNKRNRIYERFVSGSLANLYLLQTVNMKTSPRNKASDLDESEVQRLLVKFEKLCLHQNDISVKVKLANFYYMSRRYTECLGIVKETLQSTCALQTVLRPVCDEAAEINFAKLLLDMVENCFQRDIFLSKDEKICNPSYIGRNLSLTTSPLVGVTTTPVYILNCEIYARFLLSMSLFHLGQASDAFRELDQIQRMCDLQQFDCNEKRTVAYYNILGNCYLATGNDEKAIQVFEMSLAFIPSPRNPARFASFSLRKFVVAQLAQNRMILAVGVAVIAVSYVLLKMRW